MKAYQIHPVVGMVFLFLVCSGLIAVIVALPVAIIQWSWNLVVPHLSFLPQINVWQAFLLYLACATALYLLGCIQIRFEHRQIH